MKLEHLADPDAFDPKLDEYRALVKTVYQEAVWKALDAFRSAEQDGTAEKSSKRMGRESVWVLKLLVTDLIDRSIWAITEIVPHSASKYLGQRYISEGVATLWREQQGETRGGLARFYVQDRRCILRHEHVVPRALLRRLMLACTNFEEVGLVLDCSIACVVLKIEDPDIPDSGCGWDRYTKVKVFDRSQKASSKARSVDVEHDLLASLGDRAHFQKVLSRRNLGVFAEIDEELRQACWTTEVDVEGRSLTATPPNATDGHEVVKWEITLKKQREEWGEWSERFMVKRLAPREKKTAAMASAEVIEMLLAGYHS